MFYFLAQEDAGPSLKSILLMQGFSGADPGVGVPADGAGSVRSSSARCAIIINMAHGRVPYPGAYVTVYLSKLCEAHADSSPWMLKYYYPVAIVAAFGVAFLLGCCSSRSC